MAMIDPEPEFNDDVKETQEAAATALKELSKVKAYTLKPSELRDFKAAHYALRNLTDEFSWQDVEEVYSDESL